MALLFQNTTRLKDIFQSTETDAEEFSRITWAGHTRNRQRRLIATLAALIVLFGSEALIRHYTGYTYSRSGWFIAGAISVLIGVFVGEVVLKKINPKIEATPKQEKKREIKYTFTDDKLIVTENFDSKDIPYNMIIKVTQDGEYYYMHTAFEKLILSKGGFTKTPSEFETLVTSYGLTIGNEI